MKTARYHKRCFDQIDGIVETNKELMAEVDRLRQKLETAEQEKTVQQSQNANIILQLSQKERERASKWSFRIPRALKSVVICI